MGKEQAIVLISNLNLRGSVLLASCAEDEDEDEGKDVDGSIVLPSVSLGPALWLLPLSLPSLQLGL